MIEMKLQEKVGVGAVIFNDLSNSRIKMKYLIGICY